MTNVTKNIKIVYHWGGNIVGKGENAGYQHFLLSHYVFVAFVEDNATMSSIQYFENHVTYFVQKPKEADSIKLNFFMTNNRFYTT